MRFPSFNPSNIPIPQQEVKYVPVEEDILLAKKEVADKQQRYDETKGIVEKIDLEEATMRLEFLEEEARRDGKAANEPTIEPERQAA